MRRFLAAAARQGPIVMVVDDIQWAEGVLLDLLESLPRTLADAPVLAVCLARPELRERAPDWKVTVSLEGLAAADVDGLLASVGVPESLRGRLAEVSAGNPLVRRGARRDARRPGRAPRGRPRAGRASGRSQCSAQREARPARRRGAGRARAGGDRGRGLPSRRGCRAVGRRGASGVPGRLEALAQRDFVRTAAEIVAGEAAYRFKHILVREAAYRATPKKARRSTPRALRRLAGAGRRRPAGGGRGDPRLPPRAGIPLPLRARSGRR